MNNRNESGAWCARLVGLLAKNQGKVGAGQAAGTIAGASVDPTPPPQGSTATPVVLLGKRPSVRLQLLGTIEAAAPKARLARDGLAIRAAMVGADSVVDVATERLPGFFQTSYRTTGIVARTVDPHGRSELLARRFNTQITAVSMTMLAIVALESLCITLFALGEFQLGKPQGVRLLQDGLILLAGAWLLGLTLALALLRWPQLARPVALCFLSQAAALVVAPLGIALTAVAMGRFLSGGAVLVLSLAAGSIFSGLFFLGRRLWVAYESYRRQIAAGAGEVAPLRRRVGRTALIGSLVYSAWVVGTAAWLGVGAVGELDYQLESLHLLNQNDFGSLDGLRARVKFWEREVARDGETEYKRHYLAHFRLALADHLADATPRNPRTLQEARELARLAVNGTPNDADNWRRYGMLCSESGDQVAAAAALERAMKIRPFGRGYPIDWACMAIVQARRGDRAEALSWLAKTEAPLRNWPDRFVARLIAEAQRQLKSLDDESSSPSSAAR
jgi:hypothetical protein